MAGPSAPPPPAETATAARPKSLRKRSQLPRRNDDEQLWSEYLRIQIAKANSKIALNDAKVKLIQMQTLKLEIDMGIEANVGLQVIEH